MIRSVLNDPPVDSLFEKVDVITNSCTLCGEETYNNTEARDAHLQVCEGWADHRDGKES